MSGLGAAFEVMHAAGPAREAAKLQLLDATGEEPPFDIWQGPEGQLRVVQGDLVLVARGGRWWTYSPEDGALTGLGDWRHARGGPWLPVLEKVLEPWSFVNQLRLEWLGEQEFTGRRCFRLLALPRAEEPYGLMGLPGWYDDADEYELLVDCERGILLRASGRGGSAGGVAVEVVTAEYGLVLEPHLWEPEPGWGRVREHRRRSPAWSLAASALLSIGPLRRVQGRLLATLHSRTVRRRR